MHIISTLWPWFNIFPLSPSCLGHNILVWDRSEPTLPCVCGSEVWRLYASESLVYVAEHCPKECHTLRLFFKSQIKMDDVIGSSEHASQFVWRFAWPTSSPRAGGPVNVRGFGRLPAFLFLSLLEVWCLCLSWQVFSLSRSLLSLNQTQQLPQP